MVVVMGSVGLIASVILVATYQVTAPYIEENRRAYLESAILDVLPGAATFASFEIRDGAAVRVEGSAPLYAGYDSTGTLIGIAVEARGQGYQDVIRILYGYKTGCECIVGMKVLESKETPGLGDKIEKDPRFLANFDSLDVRIDRPGGQLLHTIVLVKSGAKTDAWQVEAITGATVSSQAIADIIGSSAAALVPILKEETDSFRGQS